MRVKYDPRDLSAVFVELPSGEHVRVPYADLGRPPVTLWEHREATRRLRAEGRRTVDEHAISRRSRSSAGAHRGAHASKTARRGVCAPRWPARVRRRAGPPMPGSAGAAIRRQGTDAGRGRLSGVEFW